MFCKITSLRRLSLFSCNLLNIIVGISPFSILYQFCSDMIKVLSYRNNGSQFQGNVCSEMQILKQVCYLFLNTSVVAGPVR